MTSRIFSDDVQKSVISTEPVGNIPAATPFLPYAQLSRLAQLFRGAKADSLRGRSLTVLQLQMFETELYHQGFLSSLVTAPSEPILYLTQHAASEIHLLRWFAKRSGRTLVDFCFLIDLPAYILTRAETLIAQPHVETNALSDRGLSPGPVQELSYLDRIADILTGAAPTARSRFAKGLSVVLHSLLRSEDQKIDGRHQTIILPCSKADFLARLRTGKDQTLSTTDR